MQKTLPTKFKIEFKYIKMSGYRVYKILPSIITISAFILGISAVKIAFNGDIAKALVAILIAAVLDLLDGKLARALDATSPFGKEIDSLSDLTCFGIATGLVVYAYDTGFNSTIGWLALSCFSVAVMLRLGRFNIDDDKRFVGYFKGMPAPSGAGIAMLPIALDFATNGALKIDSTIYSLYIFLVSFLLISSIPTLSIKYLSIKKSHLPVVAILVVALLTGLFKAIWLTLVVCGVLYILTIPYTILKFTKKHKAKA